MKRRGVFVFESDRLCPWDGTRMLKEITQKETEWGHRIVHGCPKCDHRDEETNDG